MSTSAKALSKISTLQVDNLILPQKAQHRPMVKGKFVFVGEKKLYIKGVTYGTFRPDDDGNEYNDLDIIDRDFEMMAANGFNAVRLYNMPPVELLDFAQKHGLFVMVSLLAEKYVGYLNDPKKSFDFENAIRADIKTVSGHPAILCYIIGNEIPSPIVRWFGRRRIEQYLKDIFDIIKEEDSQAIATYVNYPSTEYLQLPFLDLVSFNVYLESKERLEAYLARLQNIAGDRPLLMSEVGLDSLRNGEEKQAETLSWQISSIFESGCVGAFIFSWTDEWYRGGADIEDWEFGITDFNRQPKPALKAVRRAFTHAPLPENLNYPRISVVVCSYNGSSTIRDCLDGLAEIDYPDFEVIVVNDGSTDGTGDIAKEYDVRVISTENRGLSNARNTGMKAATGEIVAYTDDDARPDPHWLKYLALTYMTTDFAGVGGPNIAPPGDGRIADAVANAPGGPVHVLITDTQAEHIPGCNCSFRKDALEAIGGFDPIYRAAGDDVDVCWRLQENGGKLGFNAAAMVWHHRRNSVKTYWKQQIGYGKAEALLEQKHPEKYNAAGHLTWGGRLYGKGLTQTLLQRWRVYQGTWGSAPFQMLDENNPNLIFHLPLMPEWYLIILLLAVFSALGVFWLPLLQVALPVLLIATGTLVTQAIISARKASFTSTPEKFLDRFRLYALTTFLHLLQPLARLVGRIRHGLTPWRIRGKQTWAVPSPRKLAIWSKKWVAQDERLKIIFEALRTKGAVVVTGGDYDRWDLEVRGGILGRYRFLIACEDGAYGSQLTRISLYPVISLKWIFLTLFFTLLSIIAFLDDAWVTGTALSLMMFAFALRIYFECSAAGGALISVIQELDIYQDKQRQKPE